jgi:metallo-beta-lactamase class B
VTANITSGHTKGCTTWTATINDAGKKLRVMFVCSVSAPGYKLVGNEKYPDIVSDYRRSYERFRRQKVDIFLGSHAGFFDLYGKRRSMTGSASNPFIDPKGYREFIDANEKGFEARFESQSGNKSGLAKH